jgi:hypothetical protein
MCVCVYIYIYIYTCICVCVYLPVKCIYNAQALEVCMHVCVCVCIYIYIHAYVCACIYQWNAYIMPRLWRCICMYSCMYVYHEKTNLYEFMREDDVCVCDILSSMYTCVVVYAHTKYHTYIHNSKGCITVFSDLHMSFHTCMHKHTYVNDSKACITTFSDICRSRHTCISIHTCTHIYIHTYITARDA